MRQLNASDAVSAGDHGHLIGVDALALRLGVSERALLRAQYARDTVWVLRLTSENDETAGL